MEHIDIRPASHPDCVFISHSSKDAAAASALVAALEAQGVPCWVAPRDVSPGSRYGEAIIDGINACSVLVLLLSEHSNVSAQVLAEVERAVSKGLSVLTLRLETVALTKSLEYFLSAFHWLDAFPPPFEPHLPRFVEAIGQRLRAPMRPSERPSPVPPAPTPLLNVPNNLPQQATSFIGRETQLAEIASLLAKTRLLTLAGSGGTGKTRLSLKAAADALGEYGDGVWLVELAPFSDPALVAQTVADVLSIREESGKSLAKTLAEALKDKRLLLISDNCEHVLSACAALAAELIRSCPNVRILASSREPLGVPGEHVYRVPSLALPDLDGKPTAAMLVKYEAARLFAARAQAARPDFALTDANALAVAEVCRHLDGIPLALELAAARVRSLSVEDVNARLDNRFRLLTGGSKTLLPRQQTLKALIDWSYDLLTDQEKSLLQCLSVFAGGWDLASAEAVCAGDGLEDWEVLDTLTALVDKSLVVFADANGTSRYRLLETVRQYAAERLAESGRELEARTRHRDAFLALAEEAYPRMTGPDLAVWLARLEAEHANLREALSWCETEAAHDDREPWMRLCVALQYFWVTRGYFTEGRQRVGHVLSRTESLPPSRLRMMLLNLAGILANNQADYSASKPLLEASLAMARDIENSRGVVNALGNLGNAAVSEGDYRTAQALFLECVEISRQVGYREGTAIQLGNLGRVFAEQGDFQAADPLFLESLEISRQDGYQASMTLVLGNLGVNAAVRGDLPTARRFFEEALDVDRQLGNRQGIAIMTGNLGELSCIQGDYRAARMFFEESLSVAYQLGDQIRSVAALDGLGSVAAFAGDSARAARFWGAGAARREAYGVSLPFSDPAQQEAQIKQARALIGDAAFDAAFAEGQVLTPEQAVEEAQGRR